MQARKQATVASQQFSTISAKRLTDILGDQAEKLLSASIPVPPPNLSQPTVRRITKNIFFTCVQQIVILFQEGRIRQGRRGRRKQPENKTKLVAEGRDDTIRNKVSRAQRHSVLASGEDSPRVFSSASETEHSSYPHLAPDLEKESNSFFEKPGDDCPTSPSLVCPDFDYRRSVSPEAGRQARTGIAGGPRLTNKENISSSPAEAEVTFLAQGFEDREKRDHLAKQAAFRADLGKHPLSFISIWCSTFPLCSDEQVRLKKERIEAEKRKMLEGEKREELRVRHGQKPGDSRCQSVMDAEVVSPAFVPCLTYLTFSLVLYQRSHQRLQNRLRAGRSRVFADHSDEIVEYTPEEKRQQEKETLRKQIEEVRRKKEEERKREEELQRLDDERVER